MMPSRDFILGMAVTETASEFFPWSFENGGSEKALKTALYCGESKIMIQTWLGFCHTVRERFKIIETREHLCVRKSGRIKQAQKDIAYHTSKLAVAAIRAKEHHP